MAIDGESLRNAKFKMDNGILMEIELKVKDIVFFRLLEKIIHKLEKLRLV